MDGVIVMTKNTQYADALAAIVDEYNGNVSCNDRDDFDKGEASGMRRTLRRLGFEVEFDDNKAIVGVREPAWADGRSRRIETLNTMLRETERRREELGKALETAQQAFDAIKKLHESALEDQNELMAAILDEMKQ